MKGSEPASTSLLATAIDLQRADRFAEAELLCVRAIAEQADDPVAHCVHGVSLFHLNRLEAAVAAFREAIRLRPDYANAQCNLGAALHRLGRYGEAEAAFRAALAHRPDYALAQTGLAAALQERRKRDVTLARFRIEVARGRTAKVTTLAGGSLDEGRKADAAAVIDAFRAAWLAAPEDGLAASQLYFEQRHACDWSELDKMDAVVERLTAASITRGEAPGEHAFINIARVEDPARNLAVARLHAGEIERRVRRRGHVPFRHPDRTTPGERIRLGYLSGDFRNHAIGHLVAGLFSHHDRRAFEVFAYSHGEDDGSAYRGRIAGSADSFVDIREMDDIAAAHRIHDDRLDILVDLGGQIRSNRMEICALRPAPVQTTYIGFPGTSGAGFLDYVFTDRIVTPETHLPHYSEAPVYLPHCYLVTDDAQEISRDPVRRSDFGLPDGKIVFCSFNQGFKITPDAFDAWCEIMRAVPGSVLWLLEKNPLAQANLRREAEARGVAGERLVFANRVDKPVHMARTALADLALDTGIYTGHVTSCDMLWAGVPVVTRRGGHFASRVSASALAAAGLPELVAEDWPGFVALAIRLARDDAAREALRARLRTAHASAPLFDTERTVRALEYGFREMWRLRCAGEPPHRIDVPDAPACAVKSGRAG